MPTSARDTQVALFRYAPDPRGATNGGGSIAGATPNISFAAGLRITIDGKIPRTVPCGSGSQFTCHHQDQIRCWRLRSADPAYSMQVPVSSFRSPSSESAKRKTLPPEGCQTPDAQKVPCRGFVRSWPTRREPRYR